MAMGVRVDKSSPQYHLKMTNMYNNLACAHIITKLFNSSQLFGRFWALGTPITIDHRHAYTVAVAMIYILTMTITFAVGTN